MQTKLNDSDSAKDTLPVKCNTFRAGKIPRASISSHVKLLHDRSRVSKHKKSFSSMFMLPDKSFKGSSNSLKDKNFLKCTEDKQMNHWSGLTRPIVTA